MNIKNYLTYCFIAALIFSTEAKAADECFEKTSRAIFKFNMALDDAILEPLAKGYNKLPESVRNGTSNFTSNIATLLSIPNHLAQGSLKKCGGCNCKFFNKLNSGVCRPG